MRWATTWIAGLAAGCIAACGSDPAPAASPDAGSTGDAALPADPAEPSPPLPPVVPAAEPCREGWRAVDSGHGWSVCDPWPETGRAECPPGQAHFPGETGCTTVGTPCPAGEWPEGIPTTALHVRPGATGGDGSAAAPYGSIGEALSLGPRGSTIALARGTYTETAVLHPFTTLWGACPAETIIVADSPHRLDPVLAIANTRATIRNLQIRGPRSGIVVYGTAGLTGTVEDVILADLDGPGILVGSGATLVARRILTTETRPGGGATVGPGLMLLGSGRADVQDAVIERSTSAGVYVLDGALDPSRLEDIAIHDVIPVDEASRGIAVAEGAHLELDGVHVSGAAVGVMAQNGTVTARDLVIRDSADVPSGANGLLLFEAGRIDLVRGLIERLVFGAVSVNGEGSHLEADRLLVRDIAPHRLQGFGDGITAIHGATATLRHTAIERVHVLGVHATCGTIRVEDGWFSDLLAGADYPAGVAALASREADRSCTGRVELERVEVRNAIGIGVDAEVGGTVVATDVRIEDMQAGVTDGVPVAGHALAAYDGGHLELMRVAVRRAVGSALIVVDHGSTASGADLRIEETLPNEATGLHGWGIVVQDLIDGDPTNTALGEFERVRIVGSRQLGALATGDLARLRLTDVVVEGTLAAACLPACPDQAAGVGVAADAAGRVELDRFRISGAPLAGAMVSFGGSLALHDGRIHDAGFGVLFETSAFDPREVLSNVAITEVGSEFGFERVWVPDVPGTVRR